MEGSGQNSTSSGNSPETLFEEEKQEIRVLLDRLSRTLPGFAARPGQRAMIAEVARTFSRCREEGEPSKDGQNLSVIQGPTGTGKTMAYLLAGIVLARSRKKTLLVSTATVSLQEQLVTKDIPQLASVLDNPPVYELAKGRGRYLCERNLLSLTDLQAGNAFWKHPPSASELDLLDRLRGDFPDSWDGDRDHLPVSVPDSLWSLIQNQGTSCTGKRCPLYSRCPFFLKKEAFSRADIVVANHDLVLSDLVLGGGILLPSPEKSLLVFDEAHHLPGKSLSHFRESLDLEGLAPWIERIPGLLERISAFFDVRERDKTVQAQAEALTNSLMTLGTWLEEHWEGKPAGSFSSETEQDGANGIFRGSREQSLWRFPGGKFPDAMIDPSRIGASAARVLAERLQLERDKLAEATTGSDVRRNRERDAFFLDVGVHLEKTLDAVRLLSLYEKVDPEGKAPFARWATMWKESGTFSHRLEASPVWPATLLEEVLWRRVSACCLTSATLMSLGSFKSFSSRCGLSMLPGVSFLSLDSPFPLDRQGVLSLPVMRSDPTDFESHTREIVESLPAVLSPTGGALVLFSSRRQMEAVRKGLSPEWQNRVLVQGERSRKDILALHEQRVRAGEASVLFGLSSFSEGLDLKGDLCTHVVIAKIPFPVPTEPVEETLSEWIRSRGGDPFREIALPEAGLRLVQAAGRLIRSETDRGIVTIFDKRLLEKNYGVHLLRSLPPFRLERPDSGKKSNT
ncbi:MAG: ATP-dependent DNA helicase DinG [Nitrospirae bacterium]|nr:ATP-dependent DNA helicase DinG [Nitrospirota bacterium]